MSSLPLTSQLHVDTLLTEFAVSYGQDLVTDFVAEQASTMVRVKKQSDLYVVWDKGDIYRSAMQVRAPGEAAVVSGLRKSNGGPYYATEYALAAKITPQDRINADPAVNVEEMKVKWLMQQVKLKRDLLWRDVAFLTGKWTSNTEQTGVAAGPGANQFLRFDVSGSIPLTVITDQMEAIRVSTGRKPNVGIAHPEVIMALQHHETIRDLYKYTTPGVPTVDLVASALDLDKLIEPRAVQNTAAEAATAVMASVFGKHLVLAYIAPSASPDDPTALAGFAWSEFDQVTANGAAIRRWYDNPTNSDFFEASMAVDFRITANDLGVMLLDAVS